MIIKSVKITNYRNLDGVSIDFHNEINFLVGENNLGKTNILELLHTIFNRRGFDEEDFTNDDLHIKIELNIKLNDGELGIFDDYFSLNEGKESIDIIVKQETIDDNIRYFEKRTHDELYRNHIRNAHFISYGSIRSPDKELSFNTKNNFLNLLIQKYIQTNENASYLDTNSIQTLVEEINEHVNKIKTFNLFNIKAQADHDISTLLGRIIQLQSENKFEIKDLGEGAKFLNSIPLVLLNQIARILERKLNNSVIKINGKAILYLIISIDEPELHLHPHSQRFFTHYLSDVMSGKNKGFNELLKLVFNIDEINGQLLIVTHSPFVILNDYQHVVRVYRKDEKVSATSGINIDLNISLKNHLFRYFDDIKEAFYSKKVIVVEGVTEQGAIDAFFKKEDIKIGLEGISIVDANGIGNVPHVMNLFKEFDIPVVGIIDRDTNNEDKDEYKDIDNLFFTDLKEFENDVVECLDFDSYLDYLKKSDFGIVGNTIGVVKQYCDDYSDPSDEVKYEGSLRKLDPAVKAKIFNDLKDRIVQSLIRYKNYINGNLISECALETPPSFKKAINCLVNINE